MRRFRRATRVTLVLAAVLAVGVAAAAPAFAAAALSATPNTDLVDFQTISVTGTGFTANTEVGLVQCTATPASPTEDCDLETVLFTSTDASGSYTTDFVVQRIIDVGGTDIDCAPSNCALLSADLELGSTATAALGFDPTVPPAPRLEIGITVDPTATVVAKTGEVAVRGSVTCSEPASVYIDGTLRQRAGRAYVDAYVYGFVECDGSTPFVITGAGATGILKGGSATVDATAFGNTATQDDVASFSGTVKLTGAGAKGITA